MRNYYIVIEIEENGKRYAYITKANESNNILSKLKIKGALTANVFLTRKEAAARVEHLTLYYKKNGMYLFDNPNF